MESKQIVEISIIELWREVKAKRKTIISFGIIGLILALIIALSTPKYYESESSFLVINLGQGANPSSISGLAGLAGISLSDISGEELTPEFIISLSQTTDFNRQLFSKKIDVGEGEKITFYDYLKSEKTPWYKSIFDVFGMVKGLFSSADELGEGPSFDNYVSLNKEEASLIKKNKELIALSYDKDRKLFSVQVTFQNKFVCAQVIDNTIAYLVDFIESNNDKRNRNKLMFIEGQLSSKSVELEDIRNRLYAFNDSHKSQVKSIYKAERDVLMDDYSLTFSIYTLLRQQQEEVRLKLEENKVDFRMVEEIKIPEKAAGPKKANIVIIGTIMGSILAMLYIIMRLLTRKVSYVEQ